MQIENFVRLGIQLLLALMMLGMGMTLVVEDFKRLFLQPKAVILGTVLQVICLPALGFFIASYFTTSPTIALGIVILSACPGGPGSDIVTYLCKADVALSVTLTAINSLLAVVTLPIYVGLGLSLYIGQYSTTDFSPLASTMKMSSITLFPIFLGMALRARWSRLSETIEKPLKLFAKIFFLGLVIAAFLKEKNRLWELIAQSGLPDFLLFVVSMTGAYCISRLFRLERRQSLSICIEVGIQNAIVGITVATAFLGNPLCAIPSLIYSPIMLASSFVLITYSELRYGKAGAMHGA